MQKIIPHLWFDTEAKEAADFYVQTFKDSKILNHSVINSTPSGDCDILTFSIMGHTFMAISAGPLFKINPSISFMVACDSVEEVERLWGILADGGEVLMGLETYPFSKKYGWLNDKYGVSWQIMHSSDNSIQTVTPSLMFAGTQAGNARKAMELYMSVFENSGPMEGEGHISEYGEGMEPNKPDMLNYARFKLEGQEFVVMDSAMEHAFNFNEAVSLLVNCDNQGEIDRLSNAMSVVPEAEQCGWLKDKFGVSWQMSPTVMHSMLATSDEEAKNRVTQAFLEMKRFDIEKLKEAFEGK